MRKLFPCLFCVLGVLIADPTSRRARAQTSAEQKPLMLVTPWGPGAIPLPSGGDWKPQSLTVYDDGKRPAALFKKGDEGFSASFILFENLYDTATSKGCRKDAIDGIVARFGKQISKREDAETRLEGGRELATTSYLVDMGPETKGHLQRNVFGFVAGAKACAEIHLSTVHDTAADEELIKSIMNGFHPDVDYTPTTMDSFLMASLLFKNAPGLAAPYYKASLEAMPKDDSFKTPRRVATDQLVMALGMSGDLKNSRVVAEMAAKSDPDYPINYYNLACADAEQGDAAQAKAHLQQAFDRRANVLKGEPMPDPTKDDSILKLKKDKAFWDWVQTLPKS